MPQGEYSLDGIFWREYVNRMDPDQLCRVYRCLCELPRLRILNLLQAQGPAGLCVCHFQEILGEPQVKISKHLKYLRTNGLAQAERRANWTIYSLPAKPDSVLEGNLKCLQDLQGEIALFRDDLRRLATVDLSATGCAKSSCCAPK